MSESKLQAEIIKWLRDKGCYVIKPSGSGIPVGCPDILFMLEGFWGVIEVKRSPAAPYRPLQKETIEKLGEWSWARTADPDNWLSVKAELEAIL